MAKTTFLSFEQPIAELDAKIEDLRNVQDDSAVDISDEIAKLAQKSRQLTKDIYSKLTPWQVSQIARHPNRPYTLDYIKGIFTDFHELHGDRAFADDPAIVGGLARFNGMPCVVMGHQKGRDIKERSFRNFGMPRPEGYRKALRLMRLAEKFNLPIFSFVDTPGAFPGIDAEDRGQSAVEALCENSLTDDVCEYIFTGLRKNTGIDLKDFRKRFGRGIWEFYGEDVMKELEDYAAGGFAAVTDDNIRLTVKGMNISNRIMALFV